MKKCRCGNEYIQYSTLQNKCYVCLANKAKTTREKDERKAHRKAKERLKTRSDWLREAQVAFNRYIRARDHEKACISCDRRDAAKWDAGHYKSVGAYTELRFNLLNCHKQCARPCNADLSGNIIEYRKRLIEKIGTENLEWLEGPHQAKRYTIEEAKEIKQGFNAWARELERAVE